MSIRIQDSLFWNNKYLNKEDGWDIGSPTPVFMDYSSKLASESKILVPGCGRGYDALYLSSKGHNVDALDFSSVALDFLSKKTHNLKNNLNIINADFFSLSQKYNNVYDYIFEYTFFCAIDPLLRKDYSQKCSSLLKKNGKIIAIFLPLKNINNNTAPPFQVTISQVHEFFSDNFDIEITEGLINSIAPRKNNEFFAILTKK